ncbi:MAG: type IV pilus modification protein PilV [Pirellulaceae bacterium]
MKHVAEQRADRMISNRSKALPFKTIRRIGGLSLIEVLIALLVLSIGLVGMASLQLTSLKSAHSSYYRSLASTAALNIEERLWQEARNSLDTEGECITDATLGNIASEIQKKWGFDPSSDPESTTFDWGNGGLTSAEIPNLTVTFGTAVDDAVNRRDDSNNGTWTDAWRQIPVTLTWIENRLGDIDANDQFQESFDYTVRITCVPLFVAD